MTYLTEDVRRLMPGNGWDHWRRGAASGQLVEGNFETISKVVDGVKVQGQVFSDGSGLALTLVVSMAGSVFKIAASVGNVEDAEVHPITNMSNVKRGIRDAVLRKAEQVVEKIVKEQSPEWLEMNREMYATP